jgi:type II secretory pathway component PulF
MTGFHFKAVASDGKLRTGTIHAETDRWVAQELRRQGLTPVYVGIEPKKGWDLKLPTFSRRNSPRCSMQASRWIARWPSRVNSPKGPDSDSSCLMCCAS